MRAIFNLKTLLIVLTLLLSLNKGSFAQFYNGSQMDFGKSRIQYKEEELWSHYKYERFDVYFYLGGKNSALHVAKTAPSLITNIESVLDFTIEEKIQFIVFNRQSDFKQSNIGFINDDVSSNIGGSTRIVGSKINLFYNGSHDDLTKQIKAGLAELYFNYMMYGGSIKEMVRNSALLAVPTWYSSGFSSFYSKNWDNDLDNKLKEAILSNRYNEIHRLEGEDAIIAGHSLWNYVAETYGKNVIPNIIYLTKISRNIESGFMFVLGVSLRSLFNDWELFYKARYNQGDPKAQLPDISTSIISTPKKNRKYNQAKLSPDGKQLIYTTNQRGQFKIYLRDIESGKEKRICKRDLKSERPVDYSYPILNWHPSGEFFTFISEERGDLWLNYYNIKDETLEQKPMLNFQKVLSYQYSPDGKKFVMSAVQNGMTDIFIYSFAGNVAEQITKDGFDDLEPCFYNGTQEIIFSSNRTDDTLRPNDATEKYASNYDLYAYDNVHKQKVLKRLSETEGVNEFGVQQYDKDHIAYLSDFNGINNRFVANFDSILDFVDTTEHYRYKMNSFPSTNYSRSINYQNFNLSNSKYIESISLSGRNYFLLKDIEPYTSIMPQNLKDTPFKESMKKFGSVFIPDVPAPTNVVKENPAPLQNKDSENADIADTDNYQFESEKKNEAIIKSNATESIPTKDTLIVKKEEPFMLPRQLNYNRFFSIDNVVTQVDNTLLSSNYQVFNWGSPIYYMPGINGLMKVGISDLFENYRLMGGVRIGLDLKSNEFLIGLQDLSKRWDKQVLLHRRSLNTGNIEGYTLKTLTQEVKYIAKYPFTEYAAYRATISGRADRITVLSQDTKSLTTNDSYNYWTSFRSEFIYDNTKSLGLNLPVGFRSKIFGEYYRQLNKKQSNVFVLGADARYYLKIFRELIWASRVATSTSFGNQKLLYYMGGVDSWLFPKYNVETIIKNPQQYAFQTLATNMRGFPQNARNGSNFALVTSEIRLPLARFFSTKPLRSDILHNFQITAFTDVGTAWVGLTPFSEENSYYITKITQSGSPFEITLKNQINPIITGYGWGLRSKLFGYFVRLDFAHGVQDGINLGRTIYLSLNTDF